MMKQDFIKEEKDLKNLFTDLSKEKAPDGFTQSLMLKLNTKEQLSYIYNKPLIPTTWKYIIAAIMLLLLIFSSYNITNIQYFDYLDEFFSQLNGVTQYKLPTVDFSNIRHLLFSSTGVNYFVLFLGAGSLSLFINQKAGTMSKS